ncbi:MAG: ABC transporter ATP-binding protein [Deltaproteobacteria bacterium]|nr:MAG: ABC transporter ATP-binding protein [Deltaproteobacteria bacterium]PIE72653.1 MAG: ABC transporter ATP-binding protein [Deltaproteobacteria bacterium]
MAYIHLQNAGIELPVYNASGRSLKKTLLKAATGGQVGADDQGRVVVRALHDISLEFKDGDKVGLVGHNGAGKSTLLRVLSRVYQPTSGTAVIEGQIGSLIDISLGIDPEATGRENIFLRAGLLGMSKRELIDRFDEIVEFTELGEFINMPLRTYSTGMHLRLAFAVSTILHPEILIMDEWLSVGDEGFKEKAEKRMDRLVQSSNILVIASHAKELLARVTNKIVWLEHGGIKTIGETKDILPQYFYSADNSTP